MADGQRLYHYYFRGINSPITILNTNKQAARVLLDQILAYLPNYANCEIESETTSGLVAGVTKMIKKGIELVWDGRSWISAGNRAGNEQKNTTKG